MPSRPSDSISRSRPAGSWVARSMSVIGHSVAATIPSMSDRPTTSTTQHPTAPPDLDAYLARFDWHPEPELVAYRDERASREALATLNEATWREALDLIYGQAMDRAMGDPSP